MYIYIYISIDMKNSLDSLSVILGTSRDTAEVPVEVPEGTGSTCHRS